MGAICGSGRNDFFISRYKKTKRLMLILDQEWYDPEFLLLQEKRESDYKFRKRAEKRVGWMPLSKREFWKRRWKSIEAHRKFTESYKNKKQVHKNIHMHR